jgi:very-short-patch-repair endonuclease
MDVFDKIDLYRVKSQRKKRRLFKKQREKLRKAVIEAGLSLSPDPERVQGYRKKLASHQTKSEHRFMWLVNRTHDLRFRFKPQVVMFGYIIDFFCPEMLLGVEVDGPTHEGREGYDIHRTKVLMDHGIEIVRFMNSEVRFQGKHVLKVLRGKMFGRNTAFKRTLPFCKIFNAGDYTQEQLKRLVPSESKKYILRKKAA